MYVYESVRVHSTIWRIRFQYAVAFVDNKRIEEKKPFNLFKTDIHSDDFVRFGRLWRVFPKFKTIFTIVLQAQQKRGTTTKKSTTRH